MHATPNNYNTFSIFYWLTQTLLKMVTLYRNHLQPHNMKVFNYDKKQRNHLFQQLFYNIIFDQTLQNFRCKSGQVIMIVYKISQN